MWDLIMTVLFFSAYVLRRVDLYLFEIHVCSNTCLWLASELRWADVKVIYMRTRPSMLVNKNKTTQYVYPHISLLVKCINSRTVVYGNRNVPLASGLTCMTSSNSGSVDTRLFIVPYRTYHWHQHTRTYTQFYVRILILKKLHGQDC